MKERRQHKRQFEVNWREVANSAQIASVERLLCELDHPQVSGYSRADKPALTLRISHCTSERGISDTIELRVGARGGQQRREDTQHAREVAKQRKEALRRARQAKEDQGEGPIVRRGGKLYLKLG